MNKLRNLAKAVFDNEHVRTFLLGLSIVVGVISFIIVCAVFKFLQLLVLVALILFAVWCVCYFIGWSSTP